MRSQKRHRDVIARMHSLAKHFRWPPNFMRGRFVQKDFGHNLLNFDCRVEKCNGLILSNTSACNQYVHGVFE
eukprot:11184795-Karenia_brevis.AAC.1